MRWIWIDSFTEFVSGRRACAVKNVTLGEDYLEDHFPGWPIMPPTLMIEGMAQTAGILVGEASDFSENVILAKIRSAEFSDYAQPGDQLRYEAVIESLDDQAAVTSGVVYKNGGAIGKVDLIFSHVNRDGSRPGLPAENFVFTDRFLRLLAVFRDRQSDRSAASHG